MKQGLTILLIFSLLFFVLASGTALFTYFTVGKKAGGQSVAAEEQTVSAKAADTSEETTASTPAAEPGAAERKNAAAAAERPPPSTRESKPPEPPPPKKPKPRKKNIGKVHAKGHITQENTKSVLPIKGAVGIWRKSEKRLDVGVLPFRLTPEDMDLLRNNHGQLHPLAKDKPPPEGSHLKHCPWGFVRLKFTPDKPLLLGNASECQVASYGLPFQNTGFYFDRDLKQRKTEFSSFKVTVDDEGGVVTLKAKGKATENDGRRDWDFNWEMDLRAEVLVYP